MKNRRVRMRTLAPWAFLVALSLAGCGSDTQTEEPGADVGVGGDDTSTGGDAGPGDDVNPGTDVGPGPDTGPETDAEADGGETDAEDPGDAGEGDTSEDTGLPGVDTDDDGIPDDLEGTEDLDGDGTPNYLDDDSDGDGIPDADEGISDPDFDGRPAFLDEDSDNDGIPDADEGTEDPDADGIPNFLDEDSDDDTIPDEDEGFDDPDGDGVPNIYDRDSDGDGILDRFELAEDPDEDGVPNYLDDDSDGDGWTDAEEYGQPADSGLPPVDRENDRTPDFLDLDSDGDGLSDEDETGCPDSTERELADSDDDGYSDLLEVVFALDPEDAGQACRPEDDIEDDVDFFFELPYLGDEQEDVLEFGTDIRAADIAFNMDTTGSMGGEISSLQTSLNSIIIPEVGRTLEDPAYSFTQFDDFPCSGHGGGADRPLILRQRVTTDAEAARAGVSALERHGGGDYFESGFEALYQTATGFGRNNLSGCLTGTPPDGFIVPPFDPAAGFVPGVADGEIGGVGFREGSVPVIIHITDAPSHAKGDPAGGTGAPYRYGATRTETNNALDAIGAQVIGVASGSDAREDLEQLTLNAGSFVPACAWDLEGRPFGCGATQCCTGANGSGRAAATFEGESVCPLVYDIGGSGSGLDASVVAGITALINFADLDLTTRVRPDLDELDDTGIDTSCFIQRVEPVEAIAPDRPCVSIPFIDDLNRDGLDDGFRNVTPGSTVIFDVVAENDCVEPTNQPQVFTAYIDVVEPRGAAVYDTRLVTILVPPDIKQ